MIIKVHQQGCEKPSQYSFKEDKIEVTVGRNPSTQPSIIIDETTVSRNHLIIKHKNGKLFVKDLASSNGTFINQKQISSQEFIPLSEKDFIEVASFKGKIQVEFRQVSIKKVRKYSSSSDSSESLPRSRQKMKIFRKQHEDEEQVQLNIKISDSSMKMLKQMSQQQKSKEERIKFMKLMGYKDIEKEWDNIEKYLKKTNSKKKKIHNQRDQDLQKQFLSSRSNAEKKGLGKN